MSQIITDPADIARVLNSLPPGAKLELKKLPTGEVVVNNGSAQRKTKAEMLEDYAHLKGVGITISEAADKYDVPRSIVRTWVYRTGDVSFVDESAYPRLINEAEVALCTDIYKKRKKTGLVGIPYFDEAGFHVEDVEHPHRSRRLKQAA